jgi:hypothetical protein
MSELSHCYAVWIEGEEYIVHNVHPNENNEIEVYDIDGEISLVDLDDTEGIFLDIG